jgi:hypothetical protein
MDTVSADRGVRRVSFKSDVRSLHWAGDSLVDYVGGGQMVNGDGTYVDRYVNWAFGFDRVVVSPSGRVQILYLELGTKAIVTASFKVVRELNRSYYCSDSYEYPICVFALADGREVIAHCPDEYNRLELEALDGGARLTSRAGSSPDVFHSRLRASPDGGHILSAGWVWHPYGVAQLFDVDAALNRPTSLDEHSSLTDFPVNAEIEAACWLGNDKIVISTTPEEALGTTNGGELQPNQVGVWSIVEKSWVSRCTPRARVGTMHELGGMILSLYGHPKLLDPSSGQIVIEWPEIDTGRQDSSIRAQDGAQPPALAVDSARRRFAVAEGADVVIVDIAAAQDRS